MRLKKSLTYPEEKKKAHLLLPCEFPSTPNLQHHNHHPFYSCSTAMPTHGDVYDGFNVMCR